MSRRCESFWGNLEPFGPLMGQGGYDCAHREPENRSHLRCVPAAAGFVYSRESIDFWSLPQ